MRVLSAQWVTSGSEHWLHGTESTL